MNPGKLDNLEIAASYGLRHLYGDFTVSPKYKLIYKSYDTGLNDGRDDLSHVLSLKIDYPSQNLSNYPHLEASLQEILLVD